MRYNSLQFKKAMSTALFILMLGATGMTNAIAQQVNQTKLTDYNFRSLNTIEERVFLIHSIQESEFYSYALSDEEGKIDIFVSDDYQCHDSNANSDFDFFLENVYDEWNAYSNMDKTERGNLFVEWRYQIEDEVFFAIYEDFNNQMREVNASCDGAIEYSSINGMCQFPASVNSGSPCGSTYNASCSEPYKCSGTPGQTSNCLSTAPNPAFYYMQIAEPGNLNIYMHSTPSNDIDFDCWGPFNDIETACGQLSCSNIVDCSYSTSYSEYCHINNAQSGQFYILLITNYSNNPSTVYFENIGTGNTGCSGLRTVTSSVSPNGGGMVTGAGIYDCGSSCTLTANANEGFAFMNWTNENGVIVSTEEEYTFTVWGNRSITANFVEENDVCYLSFNLYDSEGDGWSNNYLVLNFEDGSFQTLTMLNGSSVSYSLPIADGNHISLGWVSGSYSDQCSFSVSYSNGNMIYYGSNLNNSLNYGFDVDCTGMPLTTFEITVGTIPSMGGTVTGAGVYDYGSTCTLTASANNGYAFACWTQDGTIVSTDAEYSFMVLNDMTLVAHFVSAGNIVFADANVKSICVSQWDTNGDGELSYVEAALVTDLGDYFQNNTVIMMFNELQYFTGLSSIGANAFYNCSNLMLMTLPNAITAIGNSAFYNCSGLIGGLTIPNSVITIGNSAFENCTSLMGLLTIGNSVTMIGDRAFYNCKNFTGSLSIPNSVVTIGTSAFQGCTAFWGTLTIGNSVTTIGGSAFFGCTGLVGDIVIPNSVTTIGNSAFYNCHSFAGTLTIGNSVTTIESSAFADCYGLTGDLVIPNSVTTIGSSAFNNCHSLTGTLTIGNSVNTIGNEAFRQCYGFVGDIVIPNSVTSIGSQAFYNCSGFTGNLVIPSSVSSIGSNAFYNCSGFSEVYYNVTNHADVSNSYNNYPPFQYCGGHLNIGSNVVRIPSNMFRNASFTGILTIPNSVISISDNAFNNCQYISGTLVIPNSINTIGISAFQDCDGLSEIIMGNYVLVVGNTAFYSCSGLLKVTLPQPVTVIGIEAFRYCTQLNEVNMQSIQAPSIGWNVFSDNAASRVINIPCGATENYSAGYWSEWSDVLNEMCDNLEITVEVNPDIAGSVTGAGTYSYSEMCTLIATGNLGYPFLNWTKNGVVVSTEATYSFGVTESCTYIANFPEEPVSYEITVAANMEEGGTIEGAGTYLYGATATLTATANEGYIFTNWTENGNEVSTDASYEFIVTGTRAFVANFQRVQTTTLSAGWNWFSSNVEITLEDLEDALVAAYPNAGVNSLIIKSNGSGQTAWNPIAHRWVGGLNTLDLSQMYMIKVANAGEITLEGLPINPAEHPATIANGNNWIAFPLSENMTVTNAFAGFPVNGDVVKSNTGGQATWNSNANRWIGGLTRLEPGKGYIYNSKASGNKTFVFPTGAK